MVIFFKSWMYLYNISIVWRYCICAQSLLYLFKICGIYNVYIVSVQYSQAGDGDIVYVHNHCYICSQYVVYMCNIYIGYIQCILYQFNGDIISVQRRYCISSKEILYQFKGDIVSVQSRYCISSTEIFYQFKGDIVISSTEILYQCNGDIVSVQRRYCICSKEILYPFNCTLKI